MDDGVAGRIPVLSGNMQEALEELNTDLRSDELLYAEIASGAAPQISNG